MLDQHLKYSNISQHRIASSYVAVGWLWKKFKSQVQFEMIVRKHLEYFSGSGIYLTIQQVRLGLKYS